MLTLYHGTRSVCSAKARIALAEKQVDYESQLVDLYTGEQFQPAYLKLNPMGVVPTLVDADGAIVESTFIIQYVDDVCDAPPNAARPACCGAGPALPAPLPGDPCGHELAHVRDGRAPARAQEDAVRARDLLDDAVRTFAGLFRDLDADLAKHSGAWVLGKFSLADVALIAYVDRLDRLGLDGFWAPRYPNVADWLARFKLRASYLSEIDAYNDPTRVPAPYQRKIGQQAWPSIRARLLVI